MLRSSADLAPLVVCWRDAQLPLVQLLVPTVMTLLPRFQAASRASADINSGCACSSCRHYRQLWMWRF